MHSNRWRFFKPLAGPVYTFRGGARAPTGDGFFKYSGGPVYAFCGGGIECDTVCDPTDGDPEATARDKGGRFVLFFRLE